MLLATLGLILILTPPATGQVGDPAGSPVPVLSGRVVHDGVGVPNNPVSLHRITQLESGEIASAITDSAGAFEFALEPLPGAAFTVYFVTADYRSVRFYGDPLHPDSAASGEYLLPVYDTTSVPVEPIRFSARYIFLVGDLVGGWEVLEILRIVNPTQLAYVGSGGLGPWGFRLPTGATNFQVGEADIMPHELNWIGDRVLHLTPVTPGMREAYFSYRLPRGPARSTLLVEEPTDTLNVYVRQPSHLTSISGLQFTRRIEADGEDFLQYSGLEIAPGTTIELAWGRPEGLPLDPRVAAVVVTVLLLLAGILFAIRNRGGIEARGSEG